MGKIRVVVPHYLGQMEVIESLRQKLEEVRQAEGQFVRNFQADWAAFGVTFSFTLIGGVCPDSDFFLQVYVTDHQVCISGTQTELTGVFHRNVKNSIFWQKTASATHPFGKQPFQLIGTVFY